MQKLVQRVKYAERHRAHQLKTKKDRTAKVKLRNFKIEEKRVVREGARNVIAARKNSQEDWETGALAPRRDVGEHADTYGAVQILHYTFPQRPEGDRWKWIPFRVGDRVAVTRGRDQGRIGKITTVHKDQSAVLIEDINMVDLAVPRWMPREAEDTRKLYSVSAPVPLEDVRLVYPLPDPETGVLQDTVIERLLPRAQERGKDIYDESASRVIAGTNTIIPWPAKDDPQDKDLEDDTNKDDVTDKTFKPHLLYPPMPTSVIDELRNKYSKYRTRHEWEFAQRMEKIDDEAERKKERNEQTMRTPLQELAELRARQKAAEEKTLSREQLAKIGEVMALEKARATEATKRLAQ